MDTPSPAAPSPIRVGVVDDHAVVLEGLRSALAVPSARPITITATAADLASGLALTARDDIDVLVCDLQLGASADGFQVIDAAHAHGIPVLVLSAFGRDAFARAAFERGAAGFVTKTTDLAALGDAIRRVAAGGTSFTSEVLERLRRGRGAPSARELAVIRGIAAGRSSDEIAAEMGLSTRTVESHVRRLFDRFGVVSRAELAVTAEREGWLSVPTD